MEKNYEYSDNKNECKHKLAVSVSSCKRCIFEVLCHYEEMKEKQKEKSDLYSNNNKEGV